MNKLILTVLSFAPVFAASVNYSYDSAGRLIRVDYGAGGAISYAYDKSGNLIGRTAQAAGAAGAITQVNTAGAPASSGIAQNTWVEIRGKNLVPASTPPTGTIWSSAPEFAQGKMPTKLNGVSVTVNGKPAYIYFFCSATTDSACVDDQVNILTPLDDTTGNVNIVVSSPVGTTAPFSVIMAPQVPSIFRFDSAGHIVATHADGSLLGPTSLYPGLSTPAKPNEQVVLYGNGFGLPSGALSPGSAAQSGSLPGLPICTIGGNPAAVAFAGLISPGLFQINIAIPAGAANSDDSVACEYNGATTPAGDVVAVQQ